MKSFILPLIVSIAIPVLGVAQEPKEPEPAQGAGLLERATGAATAVTDRAAEAIERARGKGKAAPEEPRPEARAPEPAPSSEGGRPSGAERGREAPEPLPPVAPSEVTPLSVGETGKGKAP